MLPFCFPDPDAQDVLHPVHIIPRDHVYGAVFGLHFVADRNVQTVNKEECIKPNLPINYTQESE